MSTAAISTDDIRGSLCVRRGDQPDWASDGHDGARLYAAINYAGRLRLAPAPGTTVEISAVAVIAALEDHGPLTDWTEQEHATLLAEFRELNGTLTGALQACEARVGEQGPEGHVLCADTDRVTAKMMFTGPLQTKHLLTITVPASQVVLRSFDDSLARLDPQPRPIEDCWEQLGVRRRFHITLSDGTKMKVTASTAEHARREALRRHEHKRTDQALRQLTRNRATGNTIEIWDSAHPDSKYEYEAERRWVTVCPGHGSSCAHQTLALARSFAAAPQEWCEGCRYLHDEIHFSERLDAYLAGECDVDPRR